MPDSFRDCSRIALFLLALTGFGCGSSRAPEQGPVGSAPAAAGADDQSLTNAEYFKLGVPAPNRSWLGIDLTVAAAVLTNLAASEPEKLPRYRSPKSGELFGRITSDENVKHHLKDGLPLEGRISDAMQMMQAVESINKLYLAERDRGKPASDECIELFCVQLRIAVALVRLTNSFVRTLDSNSPFYTKRMDNLRTMRMGFSGMISGAVTVLSEREVYSVIGRKRLLRKMQETLGEILPSLPEEDRAETRTRLISLKQDPDMADLEPELSELLDAIGIADDSR